MNIKVAEKRLSINVYGNTCFVIEGECTDKKPADDMSQPLQVYYSLAGESQPELSSLPTDYTTAPPVHAYRYDWTFGITCIEGYDWKWLSKLQDNDPILIQLTISCNPENCFTVSEFASFLLTLQPSRDTTPLYEKILANLTKSGETVGNLVKTLNDGIGNIVEKSMQLSNII
ncbi:MAG: hypothetical protein Q8880_13305, partial [Bacteroidota bacterium]|nr:hypothetical protein [Bacteroidota bacterium]